METLATPLGAVIIATRRGVWSALCAHARQFRLTGPQFWGILALRDEPEITPGRLAERLYLDAPATSRLVAFLVRRRLVEPRPDRDDRRRTRLQLTAAGAALAERLHVARDQLRDALEAGFSPEEVAALRGGLRRVLANAQHLERACARAAAADGATDRRV